MFGTLCAIGVHGKGNHQKHSVDVANTSGRNGCCLGVGRRQAWWIYFVLSVHLNPQKPLLWTCTQPQSSSKTTHNSPLYVRSPTPGQLLEQVQINIMGYRSGLSQYQTVLKQTWVEPGGPGEQFLLSVASGMTSCWDLPWCSSGSTG